MISKGRLAVICNKKSGVKNDKPWQSSTIVIRVDDQYNPNLVFGTFNKSCTEADAIPIGSEVEVEWNPGGREYNGSWYPEMKAWKITQVGGAPSAPLTSDTNGSDLPF
jgi:hypothetical protein